MKVVIIGSNHAGIACANTLLTNFSDVEVTMIDRNTNLSYLGCGTALWVGRQIDGYESLFYTKKEDFEAKGAKIYMETHIVDIDYEKKIVRCHKVDGINFDVAYDKLVLACGSHPVELRVPGKDLDNIHFLKLFQDGQSVDLKLENDNINRIAVIGAGYIGVEIAEACKRRGKEVLLFEASESSVSSYYDKWFTDDMDKVLVEHGIECHFKEKVLEFKGNGRVEKLISDRSTYDIDLVINAVGFAPNNELAQEHLDLYKNGAILVDKHQQTSDKDVYAIGDCATIYSNASSETTYIALATNAVRTGVVAALNIGGVNIELNGVQGSNAISIYGYNMVSTGLSVKACLKRKMEVEYTDYCDLQKPGFMKHNNDKVKIRIVYDKKTRKVVGCQMASRVDISMGIHMFSLAISKGVTIDELKLLDIFFLPHFNQPYNYITMAALSAK